MPKQDKELPRVSGNQLTTTLKKCGKCKRELSVDCFYSDKSRKYGISSECKECATVRRAKYHRKVHVSHETTISRRIRYEKQAETGLKMCLKCSNITPINNFYKCVSKKDGLSSNCKKCAKETRTLNSDKNIEYQKIYRHENKEVIAKNKHIYGVNRAKKDKYYRLTRALRSRIRCALKNKTATKINSSISLLGCSIIEYKSYLESLFTEGMTWDNHGVNGWHIDHSRPCASFDLTDPEQQKECFNYKNTQPLWAEDNLKKGATL